MRLGQIEKYEAPAAARDKLRSRVGSVKRQRQETNCAAGLALLKGSGKRQTAQQSWLC